MEKVEELEKAITGIRQQLGEAHKMMAGLYNRLSEVEGELRKYKKGIK